MKRVEKKDKKEQNLIVPVNNLKDFTDTINKKKWCLVYFCGEKKCEEDIKKCSNASSLCLPNKEDSTYEKKKCFKCGVMKTTSCLFG